MGQVVHQSYVCLKPFKPGIGCKSIQVGEVVEVELYHSEFQIVKASQFLPWGLVISLNDLAVHFEGVKNEQH